MRTFETGDRVLLRGKDGKLFCGTVLGREPEKWKGYEYAVRLDDYEDRYRSDELYQKHNPDSVFERDHHSVVSGDRLEAISE